MAVPKKEHEIPVRLHGTCLHPLTLCVTCPQRMSTRIENEIAILLQDKSVLLIIGGKALSRFQRVTGIQRITCIYGSGGHGNNDDKHGKTGTQ